KIIDNLYEQELKLKKIQKKREAFSIQAEKWVKKLQEIQRKEINCQDEINDLERNIKKHRIRNNDPIFKNLINILPLALVNLIQDYNSFHICQCELYLSKSMMCMED